ncbi:MAG: DNA primase [Phycisphaerae bacterium]
MSGYDGLLIRNIQSANDIVDVVGEHVALKRAGKNFVGLCPFHREKTPSFNVSPEKQIFKCYGCGAGGDVIKFVQKIMTITFLETVEVLARRANIPLPEKRKMGTGGQEGPSKSDLFKVNLWASKFFSHILWDTEIGGTGREYLAKRGLKEDICKTFSIGFAPVTGRGMLEAGAKQGISPQLFAGAGLVYARENTFYDMFRGRIIFPIFDVTGNVVGFGGRTLGDDQPKYLNTPETAVFQKQRNLFGLFFSREAIQEKKQVVVVEGYTDCMAPFQAGVKNVVATLGTALTELHVQTLRRYADQIVLVFDADAAGQKAADRALNVFLTMGVDVKLAQVTSGKDPCDLVMAEGGGAFEAVIAGAVDALEYKWRQLQQRYKVGTSVKEKRAAIDDLLSTVAGCDPYGRIDVIQKGMLMSRLAVMLDVPADQLHGQLQKYRRRTYIPVDGQTTNKDVLPSCETVLHGAFRDVLEIMICEPGYISSMKELLSLDEFAPEVYGKIARYLWQCHEQLGEFTLAELLGMVEEVELGDIITQLHREGSRKGNHAKTLEDAMKCIKDNQREQEAAKITASLGHELTEEETDRQLQALFENLQLPIRRIPGAMVD